MNKYVLYFGADTSESRLLGVRVLCVKIMSIFDSEYLRQRAISTLFACGLYVDKLPLWVTML